MIAPSFPASNRLSLASKPSSFVSRFASHPPHFHADDALSRAKEAAVSGMDAQTVRLQTISENLANIHTTAADPYSDPYRRRMVVFVYDKATGKVRVARIIQDPSDFPREHSPMNPAADEQGFVKLSNVNSLAEMADLRQADQSFSACLRGYETIADLEKKVVELIKD
ncbi:MAG: flagellar basal body protein [Holosporales bacterium]|jgi:flagellar basal-body rod protein FlgC|nr:flagellar basal body protein [Holosporales bacterium]